MEHRTREIKNLFPLSDWSHCSTIDNSADLRTRGINTAQLHSTIDFKATTGEPTQAEPIQGKTGVHPIIDTCYSTLNTLLAVTAYVVRICEETGSSRQVDQKLSITKRQNRH